MEWWLLGQTLLRGLVAYVVLLAYIRVSGNRTLAKLRAFDFVVTIALGSLLATTLVSTRTPLWQGLVAMALLIVLQWVVARWSVESPRFNRLVTNEALLLYHGGAFDEAALRRARITREEVRAAVRRAGVPDVSGVGEVWLEVNGTLSVVRPR